MNYGGPERRRHPRVNRRFLVSYRILDEYDGHDISQTKNFGTGGMLLTTNVQFKPGTGLALEIRLPFDPNPIMIVAEVQESHKVVNNLIYDTRLRFVKIDEKHKKIIDEAVSYYIGKDRE